MFALLGRKLPDFALYTLSILAGFLLGAIILLGLPLKWITAIILAIGLVVILLIVRDAERVLLFVLTIIIPFHIGTGLPALLMRLDHTGPWKSLDIQFIDILVISLLMLRLARLATHQPGIRLYPVTTVPALAWLVASTLSIVNAKDVELALIPVGQLAKLLLLYLVVANSIKDETDIKWFTWALLAGALFEGLLGIYQWIVGRPLGFTFLGEGNQLIYGRPSGTIGHPNGYGAYLAATISFGLVLLFSDIRGAYKALVGLMLGVGILGLVFSQSRGSWLSFVVTSIAVLAFAVRRRRQSLHIALVGAGLTLLMLILPILTQRDLIISRLTSAKSQESALSRITLAQGAIAMIQDYPVLGVAPNHYSLLMPKYDAFDFARERQIVIVHDIYLLVAAETGLIGLAAFLWFLGSLFVQAQRLISQAPNDSVWLAGVAAFSAFVALTVHGIADYDVIVNNTVFRLLWVSAAIVASLNANLGHERVASKRFSL